jgi:hypothetical protein
MSKMKVLLVLAHYFPRKQEQKRVEADYFAFVDWENGVDGGTSFFLQFREHLTGSLCNIHLIKPLLSANNSSSICVTLQVISGSYFANSKTLRIVAWKSFPTRLPHIQTHIQQDLNNPLLESLNCTLELEGLIFENFSNYSLISRNGTEFSISNSALSKNNAFQGILLFESLLSFENKDLFFLVQQLYLPKPD